MISALFWHVALGWHQADFFIEIVQDGVVSLLLALYFLGVAADGFLLVSGGGADAGGNGLLMVVILLNVLLKLVSVNFISSFKLSDRVVTQNAMRVRVQ